MSVRWFDSVGHYSREDVLLDADVIVYATGFHATDYLFPMTIIGRDGVTIEKAWAETISKSEAIKKYANSRGALFAPSTGEAAQKAVFPAVQANAWLLFNGGKAKVSPDTVGIPKP